MSMEAKHLYLSKIRNSLLLPFHSALYSSSGSAVTSQTKASVTLFQLHLLPQIYCTASVALTKSYCDDSYTNITKCVCNAEFHHLACQTQVSLTGDHRSPCQKAGADFSKRHLKYIISVILLSETENANEVPPVYPDTANVFREKCKFEQRVILLSKITGEQKYKRDLQVIILDSSPSTTKIRTTLPFLCPSPKFPLQTWSTIHYEPLTNVVKSPHLNAETLLFALQVWWDRVWEWGRRRREVAARKKIRKGKHKAALMQSCCANSKAYRIRPYIAVS